MVLVAITAGTGLVVAVVLRTKDNILKVIGTAASLITIAATQYLLNPALRASTFTTWKICGGGIVAVTTWCYSVYSQQPEVSEKCYLVIPLVENIEGTPISNTDQADIFDGYHDVKEESSKESSASNQTFHPNATKILACACIIAFITFEVALKTNLAVESN